MGTWTLRTQTLWEEIWPTMPGERHGSTFKMCKEKRVTLFWVGKGKENKVMGIFWALYICSPSVAILYLILTLKTPRGRHQPRYINEEPKAQRLRHWSRLPGDCKWQTRASRAACPLHRTMLFIADDLGMQEAVKTGDKDEVEGMTYCTSLKTFESKRSITYNHAWTIRAKQLPWHSRPVGLLTQDATVAAPGIPTLPSMAVPKDRPLLRGTLTSLIDIPVQHTPGASGQRWDWLYFLTP